MPCGHLLAPSGAPWPDRRAFIKGAAVSTALGCGAAQASAPSGSDPLVFQVRRNDAAIGTHRLDFIRRPGATTINIDAAFAVGFGFITFYRYHHQGVEEWRDGQFQSLTTTTNDNGKLFHVRATRTAAGIVIKATGLPDQLAPSGALPLTHWAIAAMNAPLFNPQTGKILRETARPNGIATVALADGRKVRASGYTLAGEAPIEDWYDSRNVWTALDATGKDGSRITYRRM